jgi:hypothetical protein
MFRNVGTVNSEAGESPKRKKKTLTARLFSCLEFGSVPVVKNPTVYYWTVTALPTENI